jgi:hypothetical protein
MTAGGGSGDRSRWAPSRLAAGRERVTAMLRARRLASVVSVAVVGVLALGACGRSSPDVAAYVGDTRYRTDRVETIYDDAQAKYAAAVEAQANSTPGAPTPSPEQLKSKLTRQDVVNLLVSLDLGKRVAAEKQIEVPDNVKADQLVQGLQMPADAEYTQLWGEWIDIFGALTQKLPPAELSDDAVMAVYQSLVKVGKIDPGLSIGQVRQLFGKGEFVQRAAALSAALSDVAKRSSTSVNPAYRPLAVPAVVSVGDQGIAIYALPYVGQEIIDLAPTANPELTAPGTPAP